MFVMLVPPVIWDFCFILPCVLLVIAFDSCLLPVGLVSQFESVRQHRVQNGITAISDSIL